MSTMAHALPLAAVVRDVTKPSTSWCSSSGKPAVLEKHDEEAFTQTCMGVFRAVMARSGTTSRQSARLPGLVYGSTPDEPTGSYRLSLKSMTRPMSSAV